MINIDPTKTLVYKQYNMVKLHSANQAQYCRWCEPEFDRTQTLRPLIQMSEARRSRVLGRSLLIEDWSLLQERDLPEVVEQYVADHSYHIHKSQSQCCAVLWCPKPKTHGCDMPRVESNPRRIYDLTGDDIWVLEGLSSQSKRHSSATFECNVREPNQAGLFSVNIPEFDGKSIARVW